MAGVVDFDPEKWSQSQWDGGAAEPPKVAKVARVEATLADLATLAAGDGLPADVVAGLEDLRRRAPPRITRPEVWARVVADAVGLAEDGWAEQALALGWSPVDLWGCSPDAGGNPDHDGLAVWIDGRRLLLLDERTCIVANASTLRSVFTHRDATRAVLLWEIDVDEGVAGSRCRRTRSPRCTTDDRLTTNNSDRGSGLMFDD